MQGAAFSGAVLVPAPLAQRLSDAARNAAAAGALPRGMGAYFSRHEIHDELAHWRAQLHGGTNEGLLARWHTALPHVEVLVDVRDGGGEAWSLLGRGWA